MAPAARKQRSWRSSVRRALDLAPATPRGVLVLAISGGSLWLYGFGSLDLLLFVVGISGLSLYGVAALATVGATLHLSRQARERTTESRRLECGSLLRTGFRLPALSRLPLIQVTWEWIRPGAEVRPRRLGSSLFEEIVARHRALVPALERRLMVQDAFGLCSVRVAWSEPGEVFLLPDVGRLRHSSMIPSLSGADGTPNPAGAPEGDRMEIRPYVPGDSVRNIVWSWFAKTRHLVVRLPELSIDRSRRVVAYLARGDDDEAAAAAARVALEQGSLGESWAFGADGTPGLQENVEDALRAIARSGSVAPDAPCTLDAFVREASKDGSVHCIVFASAAGGPWVQAALGVMREHPASLSFVLGTDGIRRARPEALWRRLVLVEPVAEGTPSASIAAVVGTLAQRGARVVIADRQSGRYYAEAASRALGAA